MTILEILERRQAATALAVEELRIRDAERERDIEQSEDRQLVALAELKTELKGDIAELKELIGESFGIVVELLAVLQEGPSDRVRADALVEKAKAFFVSLERGS